MDNGRFDPLGSNRLLTAIDHDRAVAVLSFQRGDVRRNTGCDDDAGWKTCAHMVPKTARSHDGNRHLGEQHR